MKIALAQIAMAVFQKGKSRSAYAKQNLHADELPYFIAGEEQAYFDRMGERIAPAICYESLLPAHAEKVFQNKATIYLASVAKSQEGIDKGKKYYSDLAKQYSKPVLLSNCTGPCDNFISVGATAAWDKTGKQLDQIEQDQQGILIFNTQTQNTEKYLLK